MNFKMVNNIDWNDLKKKVDADLQADIDAEAQAANDVSLLFGKEKGIINLKIPSDGTLKSQIKNDYFSSHLVPRNVDIDPFNLWGNDSEDESEEDEEELDENDDWDYNDEDGELPEVSQRSIEKYAWNNHSTANKDDIYCKHLTDQEEYKGDTYLYPICKDQDICLCKECNMILASKIMEQMALEMFL